MTEDARGYRSGVTYYNDQLRPIAGCGSVDALARVRKKAVDAGWLHYEPGGNRRAGVYWVLVPNLVEDWDDHPTDEGDFSDLQPPPEEVPQKCGESPDVPQNRGENRDRTAFEPRLKCGTIIPVPVPNTHTPADGTPEWVKLLCYPNGFKRDDVTEYVVKWVAYLQKKEKPIFDPPLTASEAMRTQSTPDEFMESVRWAIANNRDYLTSKPKRQLQTNGSHRSNGTAKSPQEPVYPNLSAPKADP